MKINRFTWLRTYFSPFKPIIPRLYIGKIALGTPYFYPRNWVKSKDKPGYMHAEPKKIGFDFVGLGWKTKWEDTDFRHEWSPIWSFVFFKWQVALMFRPIEEPHYWECWLAYEYYKRDLDKARKLFPCIWKRSRGHSEYETICYWDLILK